MSSPKSLPVGKLPPDKLARLLVGAPLPDPAVLLGPGIGLDCAVVEHGDELLVLKSDPITFASDLIGWYAVQVNTNDIATCGAQPRWFLATLLLPQGRTGEDLAEEIMGQVFAACRQMEISVVGGHTEITSGIERPILVGTLIGAVSRRNLVTPRGAQVGDVLLLTKSIPIEAIAILGREFSQRLEGRVNPETLQRARDCLFEPGISVLQDARIACQAGRVHAMHDPTEGGLAAGLWELAEASQTSLWVERSMIPITPLWAELAGSLDGPELDPLAAIASGALLLAAEPADAGKIIKALVESGIPCCQIGGIEPALPLENGQAISVWEVDKDVRRTLPRPEREEIARLFDRN